jgi:transcriptional regulator with XRE-family HTH domain
MPSSFSKTLSLLRREQNLSQRQAADDLGISQALLSHYEKGIREPGLAFVSRACDYYKVSADYLLGRSLSRDGTTITAEELHDTSAEKGNVLRGSVMAMLQKKLLANTAGMLFDLLGKTGDKAAIGAASAYLGDALYKCYRHLFDAAEVTEHFSSVDATAFRSGAVDGDMHISEAQYAAALEKVALEKGTFPDLSRETIEREHAAAYQSALQLFHTTVERVDGDMKK